MPRIPRNDLDQIIGQRIRAQRHTPIISLNRDDGDVVFSIAAIEADLTFGG